MKKLFLAFNLIVSVLLLSQQKTVDTAQVIIPNRVNAPETISKPYLILISVDGYRYDYTQKYQAKNIAALADNGVAAKAMLPSYPSITFPNHWSIITGLYPSHHGIIDNFFYDYKRNEAYMMSRAENAEDGSWYGGTPLWSLAESQGVVSASMQWVGSASDAGKTRPTYYYHYHEKFSPQDKIKKVVNWLKLPEENRPHFISLYFPEVDAAGHHFGPESQQTEKAVQLVDSAIGSLVKEVRSLGLDNVNFVFVSDHGMKEVNKDQPLEIPEVLLNKEKFDFFNAQTLLRVKVKYKKDIKNEFRNLKKNKTSEYEVYLAKRFPKKLNFGTKDDRFDRIGDILLLPKSPNIFLEKGRKTTSGKHGYNVNDVPEMKAVFYANGPLFKNHMIIDEFQNVNVYPLIAQILGLKISEPIDGKSKVLDKILK